MVQEKGVLVRRSPPVRQLCPTLVCRLECRSCIRDDCLVVCNSLPQYIACANFHELTVIVVFEMVILRNPNMGRYVTHHVEGHYIRIGNNIDASKHGSPLQSAGTCSVLLVCNKLCRRPPQHAPAPCKLTCDLLTFKVVSESSVIGATSVPILVFLVLSVLDLGPMYATNRQTSDPHHRLMPHTQGRGIIKQFITNVVPVSHCWYLSPLQSVKK